MVLQCKQTANSVNIRLNTLQDELSAISNAKYVARLARCKDYSLIGPSKTVSEGLMIYPKILMNS